MSGYFTGEQLGPDLASDEFRDETWGCEVRCFFIRYKLLRLRTFMIDWFIQQERRCSLDTYEALLNLKPATPLNAPHHRHR